MKTFLHSHDLFHELEISSLEDGVHIDKRNVRYYVEDHEIHREDGPAIIWPNDRVEWYHKGIRHREDGPAITARNTYKEWWVNGDLHREDGPAVEYSTGDVEWWYKDNIFEDVDEWGRAVGIVDTEDFVLLKLKYGT